MAKWFQSLIVRRTAVVLWYGAISLGSSMSGSDVSFISEYIPDKLIHTIEFSGLGWLLCWWAIGEWPNTRYFYQLIMALGFVLGLLDEVHQYFTPDRTPDLMDLLTDVVGVGAGMLTYVFVFPTLKPK